MELLSDRYTTVERNAMAKNSLGMGRRRALLTDRERELIANEDLEGPRYVVISRVRSKVRDELPEDIELLREHHPQLLEEIHKVVCNE
ncbi:hypothetical protein [Halococcus thailandensis]|uniref:hypothetical protein n=1 Tax=Halococcus thailandensis TaxID=335952 RepID=UPI001F4D2921|nr:hypothetical protein [Halococcus thailandensis]